MNNSTDRIESLTFGLKPEDGWPPVAAESLPFRVVPEGYLLLVPPLFVRDLSVGDVLVVTRDRESEQVVSWQHLTRSPRTTIWLLRMKAWEALDKVLADLRALGCNTTAMLSAGAYSVDVPESLELRAVDLVLARLDEHSVAVAFPSMRHPEPDGPAPPT